MKRILSILAIFSLIAVSPVAAQAELGVITSTPVLKRTILDFGIKTGVNLPEKPTFDDVDNLKSDIQNNTGSFVGASAKVILPLIGVGVEANLLYSQNDIEVFGETLKSQSINVPLYLRYELTLPLLSRIIEPFASIGPEFEWNIGDRSIKFEDVGELASREYRLNDSNVSLNFGLGVTLFTHIQLHANYNLALGKTADITKTLADMKKETAEIKTNTWQVSLTYIF
jgi:hypothetical protein